MAFAVSTSPRATADYIYEMTEDGLLIIIDLDLGNRSVTNDMQNVLVDIAWGEERASLAGCRITYRDSEGNWSRVVLSQEGRYERVCSFGKRVTEEAEALMLLRQVPK
ncbi:hypothetical protein [Hymenobacter sp. YC55]|uniref:hypothetical protein n=1 Tax=Hymenobacter sp. YC55 TaxID=3034019 RepID=UPI0023F62ED7|nr:hypothetical protein [Hymenobacter sp. YC55]MDF7815342.1 hypothetical protein [Hymenobacter sp. YC55]